MSLSRQTRGVQGLRGRFKVLKSENQQEFDDMLASYLLSEQPVEGIERVDFLSTAGNSYDADHFGDTTKLPGPIRLAWGVTESEVRDETMFNVFRLDNGRVRHFGAAS